MRYSIFAAASLLMAFTPTSTVNFTFFRGSQGSESIVLSWAVSDASGIKDFGIEKASQLDGEFSQIGEVPVSQTASQYTFTDNGILKETSTAVFEYRIRVDFTDPGSSASYSDPISVTYNFSSSLSGVAKRTWGSIKAMFR